MQVIRQNSVLTGVLWGLLQSIVLTLPVIMVPTTAFATGLGNDFATRVYLLVLGLTVTLASSIGYLQQDPFKTIRAMLISLAIAQPIYIASLFGLAHPGLFDQARSALIATSAPSTKLLEDSWFLTLFIIGLDLTAVFAQVISASTGFTIAGATARRRKPTSRPTPFVGLGRVQSSKFHD